MSDSLKRTPLYDEHVELGGKIVPFAGFEMPVHYAEGITAEHRAVRESAGLFDVSHMGEFFVTGPQALDLVQRISVNDAARMEIGQAQYSAMCDESGGVVDDLLVYRFADRYMLVVNAANLHKDLTWIRSHAEGLDVKVRDASTEMALLALQGPVAREVLRPLVDLDLDGIPYYRFAEGGVRGTPAVVSATGYTGEDGFELYVPAETVVTLWTLLLEEGGERVAPAGLGARDSLRLEMGYPLYGNDLDAEHTVLEAGLGWLTKLDKGPFVGRDALRAQKEAGLERRLVGLRVEERGFPRPGYPVRSEGTEVGHVTSGTVSPSLGHGVAMGYVPTALAAEGTTLQIDARGRLLDATVVRPPFYREGSIRR
ncbi:MAG: glycine cleavage system aminomethyltransferase GcvT [Gemmatimonadota bacterium]